MLMSTRWKSSTVAEGYLADSIESKNRIARSILSPRNEHSVKTSPLNSASPAMSSAASIANSCEGNLLESEIQDEQLSSQTLQNLNVLQQVTNIQNTEHSIVIGNKETPNSIQGVSFSNLSNCSFHIHNYYK